MNDPFDSPKRRVARAQEHLHKLEASVAAFSDSNPHAAVIERDTRTGYDLHKIKLTRPLPSEFEDIAFDVASNLRAALDQAGYVTAIAAGVQDPKSTYFPIADSEPQLHTDVIGRGRCKDLPTDILALFLSFQPYKSGNYLIWALNRVANANKHRLVVPVGTYLHEVFYKSISISRPLPMEIPKSVWDSEKNELIIVKVGPGSDLKYDVDVTFSIAFGPVDGVAGEPVIRLLGAMAGEVVSILLATELEANRIGLFA